MEELFTQISGNQLAVGGIAISAATYILYQLKAIPIIIWTHLKRCIILEVTIEEQDYGYFIFDNWFNEQFPKKVGRNTTATVYENRHHGFSVSEFKQFFFRNRNDVFWLRYGGKLVFVKKYQTEKKTHTKTDTSSAVNYDIYTLSSFFNKRAIEKMFQAAADRFIENNARKETITVNVYDSHSDDMRHLAFLPKNDMFSTLYFEGKEELMKDLDTLAANRERYVSKGYSHKRGYLLYGKPGNGKTSIAKAIGQRLRKKVVFLPASTFSSDAGITKAFASWWAEECVIVIEDIDCFLEGRKILVENEMGATTNFSTVLNVLDGMLSSRDNVVVLTTNHPEVLDPALTRPGRIDYKLYVDNPTLKYVNQFAEFFYDKPVNVPLLGAEYSMSEIKNLCLINMDTPEKFVEMVVSGYKDDIMLFQQPNPDPLNAKHNMIMPISKN